MSRSSSATNSLKSVSSEESSSASSDTRRERRHRKLLKQYYSTSDEDEEVKVTGDDLSCHTEGTLKAQTQNNMADMHIIAKVGSKVNIQINHYQFLFLMRLVERFVRFMADMEEDTVAILQSPIPSKKMCVALVLREVEFAMIGPPVPEPQSCQSSPVSEDLKDTMFEEAVDAVPDSQQPPLVADSGLIIEAADDSCLPSSIQTNGPQVNFSSDLGGGLEPPSAINKSHSDSDINCFTSSSDLIAHNGFPPITDVTSSKPVAPVSSFSDLSTSGEDFPRVFVSSETGCVSMSLGTDSPLGSSPKHSYSLMSKSSTETRDVSTKKDIKKSINNAFTNFSKGFGNLNSKIKQNLLDVADDSSGIGSEDWETMSQKSGMSDDDEDFLVINLQNFSSGSEAPVFDHRRRPSDSASITDGASDEKDADVSSLNTLSSTMGVVSVVTFKLYNTHVIVQNSEAGTVISAELSHLEPCEHGNISIDKFQQLFTADSKEDLSSVPQVTDFPVKLRLELGERVEVKRKVPGDRSYLHAVVDGVDLTFNISSLTNITDIMEDEVIAPMMPLLVEVSNCSFTIKSDTPPVFPTSPGVVPMTFKISKIVLDRTSGGVYSVKADTLPDDVIPFIRPKTFTKDTGVGDDVIVEETIQMTLNTNGHDSAEEAEELTESTEVNNFHQGPLLDDVTMTTNDKEVSMEMLQKENVKLLTQVVRQNDEIATLEQERDSLLATLRLLQNELQESEELRLNLSSSSR